MTSFENSPMSRRVLELICETPGMTTRELSKKVPCHPKTVAFCMGILRRENMVTHRHSLEDVRHWTWYPLTGMDTAVIKIEAKS